MRLFLILICFPAPTFAWEFTALPLCTLHHSSDSADIVLTHDPAIPLYTLSITRKDGPWAPSPEFGMAFQGGMPITIGTSRHQIDGNTLTVADSGFGNVLNGLEFNQISAAFTQSQRIIFSTEFAAPEVQKFRRCPETAAPTS